MSKVPVKRIKKKQRASRQDGKEAGGPATESSGQICSRIWQVMLLPGHCCAALWFIHLLP